jgi:2,5-diketo-D-gluconate reductase A
MTDVPNVTLANGVTMPTLGFGTSPLSDTDTEAMVGAALRAGYRLIDTAENYRNEEGVGRAIRSGDVDPAEVFVTTKFNRRWHGVEEAQQAYANSLKRLGLDRIDLLLIHWPNPEQDRYVDAWRGMQELLADGRVRAIGVSNFKPSHLDRLADETDVMPHVNQIQLDPRIGRATERAYHADHGIVTESWSPLSASGGDLLDEPVLAGIAQAHGKTPAQVVLRWHLQHGVVAIPRTSKPERLPENLDVFDFALDDDEMASIDALDRGGEGAVDSDRFGH